MHLCSIDWWFHLPFIYVHCTRYSSGCSLIQGIYAQLTGGVHLPSIYMHCTRSSSGCSGMQGICAWLTGGFIFHLYICIVLDLALSVVVCKASVLNSVGGLILAMGGAVCKVSMLNWLGVYLPSIYMHCTRCSSGCSGMQGICAWLTGGFIFHQGIYAWLTGGVHLPSVYMHCTRYSSWCSLIQGIHAWLTGGIICLLYICIVLDIVVDVALFKASMLDWQGMFHLPSIYMHCTRCSSGCSGMQGICGQFTGESNSSSGCSSVQSIYAQLTGGLSAFYICALYYI